jgi:hypothetical protein
VGVWNLLALIIKQAGTPPTPHLYTIMSRGRGTATAPRWNSSSTHGRLLEQQIDEMFQAGELIDNVTTLQEVLDKVPEVAAYNRDSIRRCIKGIASCHSVNLVMGG